MEQLKLGEMERKFAELIWVKEPVPSGELVELCSREFSWKKSTTYTMLKRLCDRDIFSNCGGYVRALLKKEEFLVMQGEEFLKDSFDGSLPRFVAAFSRRKKLSVQEIASLQRLIDESMESEDSIEPKESIEPEVDHV